MTASTPSALGRDPGELDLATATTLAAQVGRTAWPAVVLPIDALTAYLHRVGVCPTDLARHGADLYLACACASGEPSALHLFEQHVLHPVGRQVRRLAISQASVDDTLQIVRMELFASRPPRIVNYSGRGSLLRWVRVVAVRTLLASIRSSRESLAGEAVLQGLVNDDDPERSATRGRFSAELQGALEESVAALPRRSRSILRLFYVDGLNIEAIGAIYHVHRATVARWLVAIRAEIMDGLRARFCLPGRLTSSDFRSLAQAVRDELALSIERVLGSSPPTVPADSSRSET